MKQVVINFVIWGRMRVYLRKNNLSIYFFRYIEYVDIFLSIYRTYRYISFDLSSLYISHMVSIRSIIDHQPRLMCSFYRVVHSILHLLIKCLGLAAHKTTCHQSVGHSQIWLRLSLYGIPEFPLANNLLNILAPDSNLILMKFLKHISHIYVIVHGMLNQGVYWTRKWKCRTFVGPTFHKLYLFFIMNGLSIHTNFSSGIQIFTMVISYRDLDPTNF